jgi:esterase
LRDNLHYLHPLSNNIVRERRRHIYNIIMKLFFKKIGKGKPLVILHGLYGASGNWMGIARELAGDFEVYLVDQRNHGRSFHDNRHDYGSMSEDLLYFIEDTGLDRIVLAGHSMGGKTAMCFAARYPHYIDRLIVIDIAPRGYKSFNRKEVLDHEDILKAMKNIDFSKVSGLRDVDRMLKPVIKQGRIRAFLMKNLDKDDDGKYFWTLNLDVLIRELDNIMDGMDEDCFDHGAADRNFPVLFIRGGKSPYIRDEDMDPILRIFPTATFETIPDAGHWLHAEKTASFVRIVRDFAAV